LKTIALKVTGKIFDDKEALGELVEVVRKLSEEYKLVIVAGGGRVARESIALARSIGVSSNYWLDEIGIGASRLNALVLASGAPATSLSWRADEPWRCATCPRVE